MITSLQVALIVKFTQVLSSSKLRYRSTKEPQLVPIQKWAFSEHLERNVQPCFAVNLLDCPNCNSSQPSVMRHSQNGANSVLPEQRVLWRNLHGFAFVDNATRNAAQTHWQWRSNSVQSIRHPKPGRSSERATPPSMRKPASTPGIASSPMAS